MTPFVNVGETWNCRCEPKISIPAFERNNRRKAYECYAKKFISVFGGKIWRKETS